MISNEMTGGRASHRAVAIVLLPLMLVGARRLSSLRRARLTVFNVELWRSRNASTAHDLSSQHSAIRNFTSPIA